MSGSLADQRELFIPLIEGIHESPPWGTFLRNLAARTGASRAILMISMAGPQANEEPAVIQAASPKAVWKEELDLLRFRALGFLPFEAMRPNRVYAIEEMLDYDDREHLSDQRAALDAMGIGSGRWLRMTVGGVADAWLILVRESDDFTSAAVATLSAIGLPLAAALRTLSALMAQRLQTALAQSALARIGVAQLALDAEGRVMAADANAEQSLSFVQGIEGGANRRLILLPEVAEALNSACSDMANGKPGASRIVQIDARSGLNLLLRKSDLAIPQPCRLPAVLGVLRYDKREDERAGAQALKEIYGLSSREAALAESLSLGKSIIEAGRELRLTDETARNYSKRIYAKTGARGQGDLVRRVLTGLAPFA